MPDIVVDGTLRSPGSAYQSADYCIEWLPDGGIAVSTTWDMDGVGRRVYGPDSDVATFCRGVLGPVLNHRPPSLREGERYGVLVEYVAHTRVWPPPLTEEPQDTGRP